jgi:cytochrome c oxidase subunit IV
MANTKKKPDDDAAAHASKDEDGHEGQGGQDGGHPHAPVYGKDGHAAPHSNAAHTHGGGHADAHSHKPNIREYMVIFVALAVLTVVEVAITRPELHIAAKPMTLALVGLALTKAAIVALYYMHLKHETKVLKMTVAIPMAAPTLYAIVLISEAAWRLTR